MSKEKTIVVKMRRYNMAGKRAGIILTLPEGLAKDWLDRGWCDRVEKTEPKVSVSAAAN